MGEQWDTEYWLLTDWFCKLNDKPVHGVSDFAPKRGSTCF